MLPEPILQLACFFGLITCSTPPGVWTAHPTVISPGSPSSTTSTRSTGSTTSSVYSPTITSTPTMSITMSVVHTTSTAPTSPPVDAGSIPGNILVIASNDHSVGVASSGLNAYGISFTELLVPKSGVDLPALNSSSGGNFGGIIIASEVSYDYGGTTGFQSALTSDQWNQLHAYQLEYGVRMVQYDVYPGPKFGTKALNDGCCDQGVEQLMSFTDTSDFPTSGIKTGAGVTSQGLYHYSGQVTESSTTKEIAQYDTSSGKTTAAVINNFDGRQQMAFFSSFDTVWSPTSSYVQHAWIAWITRGLYAGHRRVNLNTQIDDMFLESDIYKPSGTTFRIRTSDLEGIASWVEDINGRMNGGSHYFVEVCHNGNGNIEAGADAPGGNEPCNGGGIEYNGPPDPPLEFKKPLGTGIDLWPKKPETYDWPTTCTNKDDLYVWWTNPTNRDKFAHISHTFTHENLDNATYSDTYNEITFNQAWLKQSGIASAKYFTDNGLVPPAITGLHNGDALRAWSDAGLANCVGDNTRPPLLNEQNDMWPYFTTVQSDGFDGIQVNPRYATRIYYNCDSPECTTQEWIDTSVGSGDFQDLLNIERHEVMNHLFGLHHDPYMFHQANLRNSDVAPISVNGLSGKYSIFQAWVETQVQEFVRLVDWPIVTIKHEEMSAHFHERFVRDACNYGVTCSTSSRGITGVTVFADGNTCSAPIPVTFPVAPTDTKGFRTEQIGSDPLTVWVELTGSPVSFDLSEPVPF